MNSWKRCLFYSAWSLLLTANALADEQPDAAIAINSANQLLRDGQVDQALEAYQTIAATDATRQMLNYNKAVALYRKEDLAAAVELFTKLAGSSESDVAGPSRYNLGNCKYGQALALAEEDRPSAIAKLQEAIQHYRGALRGDPENADARANIELAAKLLEQWKQPEQEKEQPQQDQQDKDQQDKDSQDKDSQDKGSQDKDSQPDDSESQEKSKDPSENDQQKPSQDASEPQEDTGEKDDSSKPEDSAPQDSEKPDGQGEEGDQPNSEQQSAGDQNQSKEQPAEQPAPEQAQKPSGSDPEDAADPSSADEQPKDEGTAEPQAPSGELTADNQSDAQPLGAMGATATEKEGLMSKEEALKLLQSIRDRDMLRRFQLQQRERRRHIPVDRDW